jgi:hypothetical protein
MLRHSSRGVLLKCWLVPFGHGFPGSIRAVLISLSLIGCGHARLSSSGR